MSNGLRYLETPIRVYLSLVVTIQLRVLFLLITLDTNKVLNMKSSTKQKRIWYKTSVKKSLVKTINTISFCGRK